MSVVGEQQLRSSEGRSRLDEWALVLSSQGIGSRIVGTGTGFVLHVRGADAEHAEATLRAYEEENAPPVAPEPLPAAGPGPQRVALAVATALGVLYTGTGPARSGNMWFAAGAADAAKIQAGELWRVVTALCLHADLVHVAGNAVLGGVLLVGLGRSVGPGLACALVLAAGAGGNLVNALLRGTAHVSVGASTAVFASVGLLGGIGAARLRRRGLRWGRALLPVAAALGVLAMLGSGGGRVDIFAHMFGLLVGTVLGGGVGALVPQAPRPGTQRLWGAAALAAVLGCWLHALSAAS